jgi:hypothetical protein
MTAIVGLNCLNGVMMMADTEETTSTYTKSTCDKLYRFISPSGTVITGGAGSAHLIDCANQELHQTFARGIPQRDNEPLDGEIVRKALNEFAEKFYAQTTAQNPSDAFEMLIAVNIFKKSTLLFRWIGNRVLYIRPDRHDVIGSGAIEIHPMLQDFQFTPTADVALFCGIRMMFYAKRMVQGVGGKTEAVILLHDGASMYYGTANTEKIEKLVQNFDEFLLKFVYTSVSHMGRDYPEETERNIAQGFADLPDFLKQYREKYREILESPDRW